MKEDKKYYKGIYADMVDILGEEIVRRLHKYYKGQQVTFPMKLYSSEYIEKYIQENQGKKTLKEMCRELGYTEGWIKILINKYELKTIENKNKD
ncbi:Mor transcription activator family protein [Paraclostridium sordellii]|uniref:Mor transcription activator family protein n=1 Tax=Paraclostridium sordellii TaxID=1505 RepID=UPI0002F4BBCE|nr:Mor transcription activator family protein [Paeniclostridium sordellii]